MLVMLGSGTCRKATPKNAGVPSPMEGNRTTNASSVPFCRKVLSAVYRVQLNLAELMGGMI